MLALCDSCKNIHFVIKRGTNCCINCCSQINKNISCFYENCDALLANGTAKLVKDIHRGDILLIPEGTKVTVTYVLKILCKNSKAFMFSFDSGLIITFWHLVRIDGTWLFPCDIYHEKEINCDEVYNFVLDKGHIAIINGIQCVTLAYQFKGDIVEHHYFRTIKIFNHSVALDTTDCSFIELLPDSFLCDGKTGLASGIRGFSTDQTLLQ